MNRIAFALLVLAACTRAEPPPGKAPPRDRPGIAPPPVAQVKIDVALAGVTLADDCPDGVKTKPVAPPAAASSGTEVTSAPATSVTPPSAGACAKGANCGIAFHRQACEQTSMQLSLRTSGLPAGARVQVKRVELLDTSGKLVGNLATRAPARWDGSGYVAWDETVNGTAELATSYKLAAPDWQTIANGKWNAHTLQFQLRVTVTVGTVERTIEKQAITPAMLEPPVAT